MQAMGVPPDPQLSPGFAALLRILASCMQDSPSNTSTASDLSFRDLRTVVQSVPTLYSCLEDLLSSPSHTACPATAVRKAAALFTLSQSTAPPSSTISASYDVSRLAALLKAKVAFLNNLRNAQVDTSHIHTLSIFISAVLASPLISSAYMPGLLKQPNFLSGSRTPAPFFSNHILDLPIDNNRTFRTQVTIKSFPLVQKQSASYIFFLAAAHRLRALQHPTIIAFHAVCWPFDPSHDSGNSTSETPSPSPPSRAHLITEHIPATLNDLLDSRPLRAQLFRLRILHDILSALVAIHATGIRHGALSARTVRIDVRGGDARFRAKLDLPPLLDSVLCREHVSTNSLDILMFRPPESFRRHGSEFLTGDVWSFGILACILFSERSPGQRISDDSSFIFLADGPVRFAEHLQSKVRDCELSAIIALCLSENPTDRLSASELREALNPLLKARGAIPSIVGVDTGHAPTTNVGNLHGPPPSNALCIEPPPQNRVQQPHHMGPAFNTPSFAYMNTSATGRNVLSANGVQNSAQPIALPRIPQPVMAGRVNAVLSSDGVATANIGSVAHVPEGINGIANGNIGAIESDDTFELQLKGVAQRGVKRAANELLNAQMRTHKRGRASTSAGHGLQQVKPEPEISGTAGTADDGLPLNSAMTEMEEPRPAVAASRVKSESIVEAVGDAIGGSSDPRQSTVGVGANTGLVPDGKACKLSEIKSHGDNPIHTPSNTEEATTGSSIWRGRIRARRQSRQQSFNENGTGEEARGGEGSRDGNQQYHPSGTPSAATVHQDWKDPDNEIALNIPKQSSQDRTHEAALRNNSLPTVSSHGLASGNDVDEQIIAQDDLSLTHKKSTKKRRRSSVKGKAAGTSSRSKENEGSVNAGVGIQTEGQDYMGTANRADIDGTEASADPSSNGAGLSAETALNVGIMFAQGRGIAQDLGQALFHFRLAADLGHVKAKVHLARCLEHGFGTEANVVNAAQLFISAAQEGESEAFFDAGRCCDDGVGIEVNKEHALEFYKRGVANGHVGCMMQAAKLYGAGEGTAKRSSESYRIYSLAATRGNVDAKAEVASCLAKAKGVKRNLSRAVELYREAANGGSPAAMLALGLLYEDGNGVRKNPEYALKLYHDSAAKEYPPGLTALGQCYVWGYGLGYDYGRARQLFAKAAEKGHGLAWHELGMLYKEGSGVERDFNQAVICFRQAVKKECEVAMVQLGDCLYHGNGADIDHDEAFRLFQRGAKLGAMDGFRWLGDCFMDGIGVQKNAKRGLDNYRKAADLGSAAALTSLASCYENGQGIGVNISKAVTMYRRAAESGDPTAENNLGILYENGKHVKKDTSKAVGHYRKAIGSGSLEAMCNLADCYATGTGVEKDLKEAVKWYQEGAKNGFAGALCELGVCHLNGKGVARDAQQAIKLLEKASDRETEATRQLGRIYLDGDGVPSDSEKGFSLLMEAADRGNREALGDVGNCYNYGRGVSIDKEKALLYLEKSAEQGHQLAKAALGNLLFTLGRYDEAFKWLSDANGTAPDDVAKRMAGETGQRPAAANSDATVQQPDRSGPSNNSPPVSSSLPADHAVNANPKH